MPSGYSLIAVYYRTNLTMCQFGPTLGVSSSMVCPVTSGSGSCCFDPVACPVDATERLWIVDGTFIPVRDRASACFHVRGDINDLRRSKCQRSYSYQSNHALFGFHMDIDITKPIEHDVYCL
ncbi:hypothetical protein SCANM124S_06139 [Streptomyces canus]